MGFGPCLFFFFSEEYLSFLIFYRHYKTAPKREICLERFSLIKRSNKVDTSS